MPKKSGKNLGSPDYLNRGMGSVCQRVPYSRDNLFHPQLLCQILLHSMRDINKYMSPCGFFTICSPLQTNRIVQGYSVHLCARNIQFVDLCCLLKAPIHTIHSMAAPNNNLPVWGSQECRSDGKGNCESPGLSRHSQKYQTGCVLHRSSN